MKNLIIVLLVFTLGCGEKENSQIQSEYLNGDETLAQKALFASRKEFATNYHDSLSWKVVEKFYKNQNGFFEFFMDISISFIKDEQEIPKFFVNRAQHEKILPQIKSRCVVSNDLHAMKWLVKITSKEELILLIEEELSYSQLDILFNVVDKAIQNVIVLTVSKKINQEYKDKTLKGDAYLWMNKLVYVPGRYDQAKASAYSNIYLTEIFEKEKKDIERLDQLADKEIYNSSQTNEFDFTSVIGILDGVDENAIKKSDALRRLKKFSAKDLCIAIHSDTESLVFDFEDEYKEIVFSRIRTKEDWEYAYNYLVEMKSVPVSSTTEKFRYNTGRRGSNKYKYDYRNVPVYGQVKTTEGIYWENRLKKINVK